MQGVRKPALKTETFRMRKRNEWELGEKGSAMIAKQMESMVRNSSAVRAMFEEGQRMAAQYGAEHVYDFSLGNPNVPAPGEIREAILEILDGEDSRMVHGYMGNAGFADVRKAVADSLNRRFGTSFGAEAILMTVGAAGGLNVVFQTLLDPGDEVAVFSPYFGEYRWYVTNHGGVLREVRTDAETFLPDLGELARAITKRTKAVLVNSPNNPTGVVYGETLIRQMAQLLEEKQREFGTSIYLVSDEPYRELVYDGVEVPYLTKYYRNTIVGYSFSKSLSLPGERIGYLVLPDELDGAGEIREAAICANRILGYVNAPSLFQRVVARCLDAKVDVAYYNRNRETLCAGLSRLGFSMVRPQGAFYMFVKSPIPDEAVFCEMAKKHHLLFVPGSSFGCSGYVRIAYCVAYETVQNALPAFAALAQETEAM